MKRYSNMPPYADHPANDESWLWLTLLAALCCFSLFSATGCARWAKYRAPISEFVQCAATDDDVMAYLEDPGAARDIVQNVQVAAERVAIDLASGKDPETADLVSLQEGLNLMRVMTRCLPREGWGGE